MANPLDLRQNLPDLGSIGPLPCLALLQDVPTALAAAGEAEKLPGSPLPTTHRGLGKQPCFRTDSLLPILFSHLLM